MPNLHITEDTDQLLEFAAQDSGISKEQLAEEILAESLRDKSLPLSAFTEEQLRRFENSAAQLKRGEFVTPEQVDERFASFFARRKASRSGFCFRRTQIGIWTRFWSSLRTKPQSKLTWKR